MVHLNKFESPCFFTIKCAKIDQILFYHFRADQPYRHSSPGGRGPVIDLSWPEVVQNQNQIAPRRACQTHARFDPLPQCSSQSSRPTRQCIQGDPQTKQRVEHSCSLHLTHSMPISSIKYGPLTPRILVPDHVMKAALPYAYMF